MNKEELVKKVLENPSLASGCGKLSCYGGFDAGYGQLVYQNGKWEFVRSKATGRNFEPTDEFVKEVIADNWRKLLRFYK